MDANAVPRRKILTGLVTAALLMLAMVVMPPPAAASHSVYGPNWRFPNGIGFLFMSSLKSYNGDLWVQHNAPGCGGVETNRTHEVWMNVQNSTRALSSMSRWVNGVHMINQGCAGTLSVDGVSFAYTDIVYDTAVGWDNNQAGHFDQGGGVYIGGRVRRQATTPAYCTAWSVASPCGSRAFIQINRTKWLAASTDTYRRREILHENGHAQGLIDCPSAYAGMMMNGISPCGWNDSIISWIADDRASVSSIYP